jgi:hypothetical protein
MWPPLEGSTLSEPLRMPWPVTPSKSSAKACPSGTWGGWIDLEKHRKLFISADVFPGLREYLLVDDKCLSVLCLDPVEIVDLGADPARPK